MTTREPLTVEELELADHILIRYGKAHPASELFEKQKHEIAQEIRLLIESHSRQLWLEAAEVAGLWERSHSCNSHDNNPCCHVRTGAEIAKRLRAKAESTPKPSPALPTHKETK